MTAPFTPEQDARIREIVREEILSVDGIMAARDGRMGVAKHSAIGHDPAEGWYAPEDLEPFYGR